MPTTVDGLATGLDTTKIIEGLTAVFQRRIALLQSKKDRVVDQQTAFKSIEARLLTVQSIASRLARSQSSVFETKTVTSSHEDLAVAAASSSAITGNYAFRINNLATAHQVASQGFDAPNSLITQGTFQVRVGSGPTTTVTINSTNNTVQGLADAINNASADVTAMVINDGSNSATDHRLLLTAKKTGSSNSIAVINNLAADNGGAVRPRIHESTIEPVVLGSGWTGTSTVTSGGNYNGPDDDTYTFTVSTGGTVGTNTPVVDFADGSGTNSGQITIAPGSAGVFLDVAEGLQVKFDPGVLVAGQTFTIDVRKTPDPVQVATNSSVTLGSGAGALTIQNETNKVDNLIAGATVSLLGADPAKTVNLSIQNDTELAKESILEFADAYNDLMEFIDEQVQFDAETKRSGPLLGNRSASVVQDEVRLVANSVVAGVNSQMNRLGALGITTNSKGRLEVNHAKLDDALQGRISGVSVNDIRRLFALSGLSSHGNVQFVTGGIRTKESTTPFHVDVSQAAEKAVITATNALAASTVIDSSNNSLTITVDGRLSGTITLAAGTYTQAALASELQAQINANSALTGQRVTVTVVNNKLSINSESYGLASEVKMGSGTALAPLGFSGLENDKGQDVVGKFIFDGKEEAAIGTGQFLVGVATNPNAADLQVRVTLTSAQVVEGAEATITVTRGIGSKLDQVLNRMLDPVSGRTKAINDSFQDQVDDIDETIEEQTELLESRQQRLLRQFVALESIVSQLKSTGDFLSAQLSTLVPQNRRR